jgi:hypothetical protein
MVTSFFTKQNFDWKEKLHTLCTDGAPAMLANTSGFATLVKKEAPHFVVTHCFLHRYSLETKTLPTILKEVVSTAISHQLYQKQVSESSHLKQILPRNGSRI